MHGLVFVSLPRDGYCSKPDEIPWEKKTRLTVTKKRLTVLNQSTFVLSKETFGYVSDCFVIFPSVEIQACLVENYTALNNLIMQKYANLKSCRQT